MSRAPIEQAEEPAWTPGVTGYVSKPGRLRDLTVLVQQHLIGGR
jgi:hypothetical protein